MTIQNKRKVVKTIDLQENGRAWTWLGISETRTDGKKSSDTPTPTESPKVIIIPKFELSAED